MHFGSYHNVRFYMPIQTVKAVIALLLCAGLIIKDKLRIPVVDFEVAIAIQWNFKKSIKRKAIYHHRSPVHLTSLLPWLLALQFHISSGDAQTDLPVNDWLDSHIHPIFY